MRMKLTLILRNAIKHRNANAYFLLTIFITDSVRGTARPESGEHIANAFVDYCKRRNCGHSVCVVTVGRKQIILGDLTADGVHRCLKDCFEVECIKKYGKASSQSLLESTYPGMLNKDNTKLTPEGIEFMSSLMANAVEIALKDPKGNHFGLEMY